VVRKDRNRTGRAIENAAERFASRHAANARMVRLMARAGALGQGINPTIRRLRAIAAIFRPVAAFAAGTNARLKGEPADITTSRFTGEPRALEGDNGHRRRQDYKVRRQGAAIFNLLSRLVSPAATISQKQSTTPPAMAARGNARNSYRRPSLLGWLASASSKEPGSRGLSGAIGTSRASYALQNKCEIDAIDANSTRNGLARLATTPRRADSSYRTFISALNRNSGSITGILRVGSQRSSGVGYTSGARPTRRISRFDRRLERHGSALKRLAAFGLAYGPTSAAADETGRRDWHTNVTGRGRRNIEAVAQQLRGQLSQQILAAGARVKSSTEVRGTLPIVAQAPYSTNERTAAYPRGRAIVVNYSPTLIVNAGSETRLEDRLLEVIGQHGYELANILEREYAKRVRTEL
jgi:hypothetical protein